jgi:hypothetical protein
LTYENIYYNGINIYLLFIIMDVLETIWNWFEKLIKWVSNEFSEISRWIQHTKDLALHAIDSNNPDPLMIEFHKLSKEWETLELLKIIENLKSINANSKYDISDTIKFIENNWDLTYTKCFVYYSDMLWIPSCWISFKHKSWWPESISINFYLKNNN